ncbi:hypothetical protein [Chroococcus sp. FPU101]|uniref:hypothetical protein n=1 Tax=Chroococcus sp. FPU101 TaxID=1974212 RepID=UPI001A8F73E7|nr:hypothetical protein [Chroococcus sp. FPU101]GFE67577.1 hypothetical protein CFPU101_01870 [Chroococcus sp. FPU101]
MLAVLVSYPSTAKADKKPVQPILFNPSEIDVATIYETTAESQKGAMSSIAKTSKTLYKKNPGFDGFAVLGSKDGNKIIVLSQWKDKKSYQAYTEQPVEDYKTKYADYKSKYSESAEDYKSKYAAQKSKEAAPIEPSKTIIFELEETQPNSLVAALRKESVVQLSQYTIKDNETESEVLDFVEKLIPTASDMVPAPRTVILLKSSDNKEVALLASWSCSADFDGLETPPSFAELPQDLVAAADNEQHLYEVLKIIPPPPPEL